MDRGSSAVFIYRVSNWLYKRKLKVLSAILYQFNVFINSCEISYGAEIGKGLKIVHPLGIVLGAVEAGENLTLHQNVTIGKTLKIKRDGQKRPILKDNVSLYAGCVIAGPVIIGNNVIVGANTVVQNDVPDGAKVIGAKPTIKL